MKVQYWVNGQSLKEVVGLTARFGALVPTHEKDAMKAPVVLSDPVDGCSNISTQVSTFFIGL